MGISPINMGNTHIIDSYTDISYAGKMVSAGYGANQYTIQKSRFYLHKFSFTITSKLSKSENVLQ